MNVICPECTTTYRVDPAKVPSGGVVAQCARCPATFRVAETTASEGRAPATLNARDASPVEEANSAVSAVDAESTYESDESATPVLMKGSRFEISLLGGAGSVDETDGQDDLTDAGESAASEQAGSDYTGASDVAFHTDEAPSDDLPYLEGSVAGAPDNDVTTETESSASAPEGVVREGSLTGSEEAQSVPEPLAATGEAPLPPAPFGARSDPHRRAARLARALVSDIVVYHPERRTRSLRQGTLRQEFREEIRKSWEEYANQVGGDFARQTTYFRDALNEILADGVTVF